mmetsp:Transcript_107458/g.302379  ORF Transcript_107458/g.302379 Transcript_107458/m.302379 type:complete len:225 (+) Transcript_107458:510-1184(+)
MTCCNCCKTGARAASVTTASCSETPMPMDAWSTWPCWKAPSSSPTSSASGHLTLILRLYLSYIASWTMQYLPGMSFHSLPLHHSRRKNPRSLNCPAKARATASLKRRPPGSGTSRTKLVRPTLASSRQLRRSRSISFFASVSGARTVVVARVRVKPVTDLGGAEASPSLREWLGWRGGDSTGTDAEPPAVNAVELIGDRSPIGTLTVSPIGAAMESQATWPASS